MRLAVILARKGSKRLPGKNTKKLVNKSLIEYTIEEALKSQMFDCIIVSTNDPEVMGVVFSRWKEDGHIYVIGRPEYLCNASAPSEEAVLYTIEKAELMTYVEYDLVCLLQPTSPLRTAEDITEAVLLSEAIEGGVWSVNEETDKVNGAIYYDSVERLRELRKFTDLEPYPMPAARSVDIDTEADFIAAEGYIKTKEWENDDTEKV